MKQLEVLQFSNYHNIDSGYLNIVRRQCLDKPKSQDPKGSKDMLKPAKKDSKVSLNTELQGSSKNYPMLLGIMHTTTLKDYNGLVISPSKYKLKNSKTSK